MGIYETASLVAVVESLRRTPTFILDTFFPDLITETSEDIHFDIRDDKPRIAPFVSPYLEGKVVQSKGFSTKSFRPAYIKDKRVHHPGKALKRAAGEQIGGNLSLEQRREMNLVADMQDQEEMLKRRWELMAIDALLDGKVTVEGEGFGTKVVDFQRDANLTVQLTGTSQWGESGVEPLEDLDTWGERVLESSGAGVTDVVMDIEAWKIFRKDPDVKDILDTRRGSISRAELGPTQPIEGVKFKGQIGELGVWVYSGFYEDPATGTLTRYLPQHTVMLLSPQLEGTRQFGAILDEGADLRAMEMFPKSWVQEDPSVRYLLMQSAPLMVPYRPNASFTATVRE